MAWKNNRRTKKVTPPKKRVTRRKSAARSSQELTRLAYQMGQIERGRNNPDSRISESYERGKTAPERRPRKTLF